MACLVDFLTTFGLSIFTLWRLRVSAAAKDESSKALLASAPLDDTILPCFVLVAVYYDKEDWPPLLPTSGVFGFTICYESLSTLRFAAPFPPPLPAVSPGIVTM